MKYILAVLLISSIIMTRFYSYKDLYDKTVDNFWPDLHPKYILAAQIEQESLWNPKAELKTSREYGFGFGQLTTAWKKDGTVRFNKFKEAKNKFKELKNWAWKDRYNPEMQLIFVVKENKFLYEKFKNNSLDHITNLALMQSAYNGGSYYLYKEIHMCELDKKCNPKIWFCNIEKKAARSTKKYKGYGKSFFDINREYVTNIMFKRLGKYPKE